MFWSARGSTIVSKLKTSGYGTMQIIISSLEYAHTFAFWIIIPKHSSIQIRRSVRLHMCPLSLDSLNLFRRSIISNSLEPLRIDILYLQVWRDIRLRVSLVAHGITHAKMRPGVLVLVLNIEVLVARCRNDFGVHV